MFIKNKKGQIAIFVVLVFQVLFILFAMTINIALVVHDKINYQNSLDLAAYYGAKQQAEVLSAMAHINYQMRQNWKLLAWRYRVLGTLLQNQGGSDPNYWCPQNKTAGINCRFFDPLCNQARALLPYTGGYCDRKYFICISHQTWRRGVRNSRLQLCELDGIRVPPIRDFHIGAAGFMIEVHLARATTLQLQREVSVSCPAEGALNGLMAQFFLTHFRLDQRDRKTMLREIYKRSLQEGKDLDGESIFEGAKKVFFNNLTEANKKNAQAKGPDYGLVDFNSFQDKPFEEFFEHFNVFPILQYMDFGDDRSNGTCPTEVKHLHRDFNLGEIIQRLFDDGHPLHPALRDARPYINYLFHFNRFYSPDLTPDDPIRNLTLGFYKKKDKTLYYGLNGSFEYLGRNQIFSLNLSPAIQFKASSFAKPFGGRFGPQPEQSDPWIPVHHPQARVSIPASLNMNTALLQPNYSRWPGDKWGLIARGLHDNRELNFLKKHETYNYQQVYTIEAFFHLIFYGGIADDPLARPPVQSSGMEPKNFMRMMELMAVYPDVFDLSYYSIAGNYMETYFQRICKLLIGRECQKNARNKISRVSFEAYIRGDFGWPNSEYYLDRNQIKTERDLSIAPYFLKDGDRIVESEIELRYLSRSISNPLLPYPHHLSVLTKGRLFYPWLAKELPDYLLSSWTPTTEPERYEKYDFPENFLKCEHAAFKDMPVPSACSVGGRSDYSVKLISCEVVKDLEPKPGNIDEYCP